MLETITTQIKSLDVEMAGRLAAMSFLLTLTLFCSLLRESSAVQAIPMPFSARQDNGESITLFLRGNEHFNYLTDTWGNPVVEQTSAAGADWILASSEAQQRQYVYGALDSNGQLQPTPFRVGDVNPFEVPGLSSVGATPNAGIIDQRLLAGISASTEDHSIKHGECAVPYYYCHVVG
jgi:hypothetical protein